MQWSYLKQLSSACGNDFVLCDGMVSSAGMAALGTAHSQGRAQPIGALGAVRLCNSQKRFHGSPSEIRAES